MRYAFLIASAWFLAATATPCSCLPLFSASYLSFDVGSGAVSVEAGDLNGDGRPDLVVANSASNTVSVLLGNGDGTMGSKADLGTGSTPSSASIVDLNADGKLDLVVANRGANTVSVRLGNGDGTFGAAADYGTGLGPRAMAVGDLNADGRADLAVANWVSNTVSVLIGNGDGTLAAKADYETGPVPISVAFGDPNLDGKPDLAVGNRDNYTFSILLGNGDGTLDAKTDFVVGGLPRALAFGDLNRDGKPDLATSATLLFGNGDGTFGAPTYPYSGAVPSYVQGSDVAIGDLNGDGKPDLALANLGTLGSYAYPFDFCVIAFLGNGDGTFGHGEVFTTGAFPFSLAMADLNADGRPDLAVVNQNNYSDYENPTSTVSVLLGNGNGTFGFQSNSQTSNPYSVALGDLNADGKLDLAVTNVNYHTVSVLLGQGGAAFGPATDYGTGSSPISVGIADLNADGRPDLAVANLSGNSVSVLLGTGNGTFGAKADFGAGNNPQSVAIGDLNGDSKPDLAVASSGSLSISVLLGNGDGTFGVATDFAAAFYTQSIDIGDLNADGKPDLVATVPNLNAVSVLLGNGDGTFGAHMEFGTGSGPTDAAIGDLNADGKPDIAVASNAVDVLLGIGDGTFLPKSTLAGSGNPFSVEIADLTADGNPDIATANWLLPHGVSVRIGNGDGTFGDEMGFGAGPRGEGGKWTQATEGLRSIAIGDLNFDGRLDVVAANEGARTVSALLNSVSTPPCVVTVAFALKPSVLNRNSSGRWVTAILEPVSPDLPSDIDTASIRLNGVVGVAAGAPTTIGDSDADGVPDLSVRVSRFELRGTLSADGLVSVSVSGLIDGQCFQGSTDIRVVSAPPLASPAAGATLLPGTEAQVVWHPDSGPTVDLVVTTNGGSDWSLVAAGLPNSGSYTWTVPGTLSDNVRLAVVRNAVVDPSGIVTDAEIGESGTFAISGVTGAGSTVTPFALRGVWPTPAQGAFSVGFSLPSKERATLAIFNVAGRRIYSRDVGSLGEGVHTLTLGQDRSLRPGLYVVRLTQAGRSEKARLMIVQ